MLSWLEWFWGVATVGIGLTGGLALFAPHVSAFITDLVIYGVSASSKRSGFHRFIEVPKRWFTHFYMTAAVVTSAALVITILAYCYGARPPLLLRDCLRTLGQPHASASVSDRTALLVMVLVWVHTLRRLLESLLTSVFSDTRMNILHYALGNLHYLFLPAAVLAESPYFATRGLDTRPVPVLSGGWAELGWAQWLGVALYIFASYQQHSAFVHLASLRKSHTGNVTNYAHGVVRGGWFELVSCPHFFFEILLYVAFFLCLGPAHRGFRAVLLFVLVNQTLAGKITHRWYQERFKDKFPRERRAIIPYLI